MSTDIELGIIKKEEQNALLENQQENDVSRTIKLDEDNNLNYQPTELKVSQLYYDLYKNNITNGSGFAKLGDFEERDEDSNFWTGLHFACLGLNHGALNKLLKVSSKAAKNAPTIEGYTPLHVLLKYGKHGKAMEKCVELLISDADVDYNQTDYGNVPPIFSAIEKEYVDIIKLLLEKDNINICKETRGKHICQKLLELGFDNQKCAKKRKTCDDKKADEEKLLGYLKDKREINFMQEIVGMTLSDIKKSEKNITFLQLAVYNNLKSAVNLLLRKCLPPTGTTPICPIQPLNIAIKYKHCNIVKIFISREDMIAEAKISWDRSVYKSGCADMVKYYLENPAYKNAIGKKLPICNTNEMVLTLLEKKAITLTQKDSEGSRYVETLSSKAVKSHFVSCFTNYEPGKKDNGKYLVSYDCEYDTLIPRKEENTNSELDIISYIINNRPDLHELLHHPGINAFLFLKWHRIRMAFALILALYVIFTALVILYMDWGWKCDLLNRTIISLIIFLTAIIFLYEILSINIHQKHKKESKQEKNKLINSIISIRLLLIILFIILLILSMHLESDWPKSAMLLLVTFDFMFYIGKHPALSAQVRMLQTVAFTYIKFLSFYSILMAAFALSFHINFRDQNENNANVTSNNTFAYIGTSAFKTVIMLAGEFEAGSISFNNTPIIGHLIFLFFVILIVIILMNLLNGLAVSDTAKVIKESKFYGIKSQVEFIATMETFYNHFMFKPFLSRAKWFLFAGKKREDMKIKVEIRSNTCYLTVFGDDEKEIFYKKNASKMRILKHLKRQNNWRKKAENKDECDDVNICPHCKNVI